MKTLSLVSGGVLGLIALAQTAAGQTTIISENFNSYLNDAALTAVWPRVTGAAADIGLAADPDPANTHGQCILETTNASRLRYTLGSSVTPSAQNSLVFAFDLYDISGGDPNGRTYLEIRNSASASGLFAAGIYNAPTTGAYVAGAYQARDLDNGGWIQLSNARSAGWHHFEFTLKPNTATLTIDGNAVPEFSDRAWNGGTAYNWINLGSALSSVGGAAYFDNVSLTLVPVPEPSTLALCVLGGLTLVYRRASQRRKV